MCSPLNAASEYACKHMQCTVATGHVLTTFRTEQAAFCKWQFRKIYIIRIRGVLLRAWCVFGAGAERTSSGDSIGKFIAMHLPHTGIGMWHVHIFCCCCVGGRALQLKSTNHHRAATFTRRQITIVITHRRHAKLPARKHHSACALHIQLLNDFALDWLVNSPAECRAATYKSDYAPITGRRVKWPCIIRTRAKHWARGVPMCILSRDPVTGEIESASCFSHPAQSITREPNSISIICTFNRERVLFARARILLARTRIIRDGATRVRTAPRAIWQTQYLINESPVVTRKQQASSRNSRACASSSASSWRACHIVLM